MKPIKELTVELALAGSFILQKRGGKEYKKWSI